MLELPDNPTFTVLGVLALIIAIVLFVWGLWSTVTTPQEAWRRAGEKRSMWLAMQLIMPVFSAVLYLGTVRPRLQGKTLPRERKERREA